jgi:hypothetical protein
MNRGATRARSRVRVVEFFAPVVTELADEKISAALHRVSVLNAAFKLSARDAR